MDNTRMNKKMEYHQFACHVILVVRNASDLLIMNVKIVNMECYYINNQIVHNVLKNVQKNTELIMQILNALLALKIVFIVMIPMGAFCVHLHPFCMIINPLKYV